MNVLLCSTYELGHQPLGIARPAAMLQAAGHQVACRDLAVEALDEAAVRQADFVGISVPMHTATRLGVRLAKRIRALNPGAHICFYGLYASLHARFLLGRHADSVVGGEYETPLLAQVAQLAARSGDDRQSLPRPGGVMTATGGDVHLGRQLFARPAREILPPLEKYARVDDGHRLKLAGYVEASRGCAHRCLHCPITPVYGGRMRVVQEQVVLDDIRQLVAMGAEHVTFGDPDFFNAIKHSRRLVEALHDELPDLTYDVTIKVEHLLEHRALVPLLRETGCLFVVSAVEAVDDIVLAHLQKGHSRADVLAALEICRSSGVVLRPTFVPFTPWTTLESYVELLQFVREHHLIGHVDPVQYSIRLLIPEGSSLLGTPQMAPYLGDFDEATFTYRWRNPDPRVDRLQVAVAQLVERARQERAEVGATFSELVRLASRALERPPATDDQQPLTGVVPRVPRLTEDWFC